MLQRPSCLRRHWPRSARANHRPEGRHHQNSLGQNSPHRNCRPPHRQNWRHPRRRLLQTLRETPKQKTPTPVAWAGFGNKKPRPVAWAGFAFKVVGSDVRLHSASRLIPGSRSAPDRAHSYLASRGAALPGFGLATIRVFADQGSHPRGSQTVDYTAAATRRRHTPKPMRPAANNAIEAGSAVAPTRGIRPMRQCPDQQQHQDDDQHGGKHRLVVKI